MGIEKAVRDEIDKLLKNDITVKSSSLWSSPLVPVKKKDGSVRICVDYRQLNAVTPLVRYWVPSLDEILRKVGQSCCLSTLDLTSGFDPWNLPLLCVQWESFATSICPLG